MDATDTNGEVAGDAADGGRPTGASPPSAAAAQQQQHRGDRHGCDHHEHKNSAAASTAAAAAAAAAAAVSLASVSALRDELGTVTRVRNRLAHAPDTKLPHVLATLTPRLLRHLDTNAGCAAAATVATPRSSQVGEDANVVDNADDDSDDHNMMDISSAGNADESKNDHRSDLHRQIQEQLTGTLGHARQRVGVIVDDDDHNTGKETTNSITMYVESVLPIINELTSSLALTMALALLQTGFPHYLLVQRRRRQEHQQNGTSKTTAGVVSTMTDQNTTPSPTPPTPTTMKKDAGSPPLLDLSDVVTLITPLMLCLDRLYGRIYADAGQGGHADADTVDQLKTVTWLLLDGIAQLIYGLPHPGSGGGMSEYNSTRQQQDDEESTTTAAAQAASWKALEDTSFAVDGAEHLVDALLRNKMDGAGLMNLLLDLLLFWPSTARRDPSGVGVSFAGIQRMNYLITRVSSSSMSSMSVAMTSTSSSSSSSWDSVYLLQLKYVAFKFYTTTAGFPSSNGQRGSSKKNILKTNIMNGNNHDRALLLAVLAASGGSQVGRYADGLINQGRTSKMERVNERWIPAGKITTPHCSRTIECSLGVACSLLILVLGDEYAHATVLDQYQAERQVWESILGPAPSERSLFRPPLPVTVALRALNFLADQYRPPISSVASLRDRKVKLYVELVVAFHEQSSHHPGISLGIRLLQSLYSHIQGLPIPPGELSEWTARFYGRCLQAAKSIISIAHREEENVNGRFQGDHMHRLIETHRFAQKRRILARDSFVRVRESGYEMIRELASDVILEEDPSSSLSFELPILLLKCASTECETLHACAAGTLESLLCPYEKIVTQLQSSASAASTSVDHHDIAAPLLPSLLCAACSPSPSARLAAVRWSSRLLRHFDPLSSTDICSYLASDSDSVVAATAKKAIPELKMLSASPKRTAAVFSSAFLDSSCPDERSQVFSDLDARVSHVSKCADLARGEACILLSEFRFNPDDALVALNADRATTLARCGICTLPSEERKEALSTTCPICYDEVDAGEAYAMRCGHLFCHDCWNSYLTECAGLPSLTAECPLHECHVRLSCDDIEHLSPAVFFLQWQEAIFTRFVKACVDYQPCSGPDCQMVAHSPTIMPLETSCTQCSQRFCFKCGEEPHWPAKCADTDADMALWKQNVGTSKFWIKNYAKPCPTCGISIEKHQGCNHMKCTQCGADFCWLCLALMNTHLEAHICNAYEPSQDAEDEAEARLLFYGRRYYSHAEAEDIARNELKALQDRESLAYQPWFADDDRLAAYLRARHMLVEARRFIKCSYVAAWAMSKGDTTTTHIYESHQATLELMTERLTLLSRASLLGIYRSQGDEGIEWHFRSMTFHKQTIERFMRRIVELGE